MTLLEQELRDMPHDQLRDLVTHLDLVHASGGTVALVVSPIRSAARKELETRPDNESLRHASFPS